MSFAVTPSGSLAVGTTAVQAHPCILTGLILNPAAAACSVIVYDNASAASGTILAELVAPASVSSVVADFKHPINALNGITAVVAGTGATATLTYARTY